MITSLLFLLRVLLKKRLYSYALAFHFPTRTCVYATRCIFVYKMLPPQWSVKTSERESGASIINYSRIPFNKVVFPSNFFSLNKALFLFFLAFFFWWMGGGGGGQHIFLLDNYRMRVKHC